MIGNSTDDNDKFDQQLGQKHQIPLIDFEQFAPFQSVAGGHSVRSERTPDVRQTPGSFEFSRCGHMEGFGYSSNKSCQRPRLRRIRRIQRNVSSTRCFSNHGWPPWCCGRLGVQGRVFSTVLQSAMGRTAPSTFLRRY